jgi:glutamate dehydrogenase (NAD(P)+)
VVQGFGNVGSARGAFFAEEGAKVIGVSDISGGLVNPDGLDVPRLLGTSSRTACWRAYDGGDAIGNESCWSWSATCSRRARSRTRSRRRTPAASAAASWRRARTDPTTLEADEILERTRRLHPARHPGQCGRRHRLVFRVGAGHAELHVVAGRDQLAAAEAAAGAFERVVRRSERDQHLDMRSAALIEGIARVTEAKLSRGIFP